MLHPTFGWVDVAYCMHRFRPLFPTAEEIAKQAKEDADMMALNRKSQSILREKSIEPGRSSLRTFLLSTLRSAA